MNNPDLPMGNLVSSEPCRARDDVSREGHDMEDRQSFPMGSIDSMVGEGSQRGESCTDAA